MATHDDDSPTSAQGDPDVRWWDDDTGAQGDRRRARQVLLIAEAFEAAGTPVGIFPSAERPGEMEYMYRKGYVLTRDVDADRVQRILGLEPSTDKRVLGPGRRPPDQQPPDQPAPDQAPDQQAPDQQAPDQGQSRRTDDGRRQPTAVSGLTVVPLPATDENGVEQDGPFWFALLDDAVGVGVAVPDHVIHVSGNANCCPATEPVPAWGPPDPRVNEDCHTDGRQVKVLVVDSGVLPGVVAEHAWLEGVTGDPEPPTVGHYRGHGTFVAGVVRAIAPATHIEVRAILIVGGAVLESDLAVALHAALDDTPDIVSMSAGTTTREGLPLLAMDNFWTEHARKVKGSVVVAAAGNDGNRGPFWPAAFPWAVSVGALDVDGRRAGYSNHGSWVDVYARGSDVVNAYPRGTYTYEEPPLEGRKADFKDGMASWSGTSFATPLVAGLIAGRMTWSGENAREAADSLLAIARSQALVGVGAVLYPHDGSHH